MNAAIGVALAATALWAYLFTFRARLVGTSAFDFIDFRESPERWPAVSVIIPARNEAEMLRFTMSSSLGFYYPHLEVILVDDCSDDGTADVSRQVAAGHGHENLRVIAGAPPPEGWRGKLWALQQGVEAAGGEWFLFLDADILCRPNLLRDAVRLALREGYSMASLMVLLRAESFWDRLLIPAFFFFFHLLYPFHRVRKPGASTAAAAGGFVLIERGALEKAGGLAAIRSAWIDDVALAGAVKGSGSKIYLGATVQAGSFRRYGTLQSIREMITRTAFTQLRYSWLLVGMTLVSMGFAFLLPLAGSVLVVGRFLPVDSLDTLMLLGGACGFAISFMVAAYAPAVQLYGLSTFWTLTLPLAAAVYAGMTVESALRHSFGGGNRWKGRRN